jgi:hypothetical protein
MPVDEPLRADRLMAMFREAGAVLSEERLMG